MSLKYSASLRQHAVNQKWVASDASDKDVLRMVARKLLSNELDQKTYNTLTAGAAPAVKKAALPAPRPTQQRTAPVRATSAEDIGRIVATHVQKQLASYQTKDEGRITPESIIAKSGPSHVRVIAAASQYSVSRKDAICPSRSGIKQDGSTHPNAGQQAAFGRNNLQHPSDQDKAICQAYLKYSLSNTHPSELPAWARMKDHDRELMQFALKNCEWSGLVGTGGPDREEGIKVNRRKLNDFEVKTLLDDSVSGGIEATPVVFDDAIIMLPVLYGELFPLVNVKTIARGRRIKSAAISQPTFTSGVSDGTPIQPFNTGAFVTAFDTAIYNAVGAMEIGMDFEEDSPVDLGAAVVEYYGLKSMEWLDRVIAVGNGQTEPLGIFNSSGTQVVNSDFGPGGPLTVSDIEALMFGLAKQYRNEPGSAPVFVAADQMYRRTRAISVGPTDQRRVFGMDHQKYTLMDAPFKVQNDIPLGKIAYFNPKRYRMYRRLGLTVRIETAGKTLAQTNTKLIVVRMRFGGQPETGNAIAVCADAKV